MSNSNWWMNPKPVPGEFINLQFGSGSEIADGFIKQAEANMTALRLKINEEVFYVDPKEIAKREREKYDTTERVIATLKPLIKYGLKEFNEYEMIRLCTYAIEQIKDEEGQEENSEEDEDKEYDCCSECG
jgi:hypothetical protein